MWCKQCQQDVRALMLPTEMGRSPHCPRCSALLRLPPQRPEAISEMAEASGDILLARRELPTSFVSSVASGDLADGASITITAPRGRRRADISIDWQWDEDRRALRRINAALGGGAMYRFDRSHLPTDEVNDDRYPQSNSATPSEPTSASLVAGGLLFLGLAALSAGAAFFAHSIITSATAMNSLTIPFIFGGQTLITFSLLFQMDSLRRKSA